MTKRILVTYASRTGSTVGVAEAIGKVLSENGARVDVKPMSDVKELSAYDAVVAGSAIQNKQWLPEAMHFIRAHRTELAQKPFADFVVCMTLAMKKRDYRSEVAQWLAPVRDLVKPVDEGLFAGKLDLKKVPTFKDRLGFRISALLGFWELGDQRDWKAIRVWANGLAAKL